MDLLVNLWNATLVVAPILIGAVVVTFALIYVFALFHDTWVRKSDERWLRKFNAKVSRANK